ncbi:glycosyltransferase [Xanthobacter flavus]|uniref:nucleotide disphospho-sugar-binding domain-containing protein n=1 Tax=Xanthobacter flavus TaxID=281 RepID=UPI003728E2AB
MTHFAVVAPPLPGHYNPLLVLARELGARGHRVTFVHMADAARLVEGKGAGFAAVGTRDYPAGALDAYVNRLAKPTGLFGLLGTLRVTAAQTDMLCRDLPGVLRDIGADAVIADQTEAAGTLVARHLGLPVISTATALLLNREVGVPPPFVPWPYEVGEKALVRNKGGYRVTDFLMSSMRKVLARHGAAFGLDPFADGGFSPLLTVAQMPKGLDFPRTELPATFHYGSPWRDAAAIPAATAPLPEAEGKPLVFCSLGTLQGARADLFRKVALAAREVGVRLLIAHGGLLSQAEVGRLSDLAEVRAFVPQQEVLKRCAAAVLHCGMNTVLDAMAEGVPLVAMPIAFEQPATAARLAYAGVAEVVPAGRASQKRLTAALRAVLEQPSYRENARRIAAEMAQGRGVKDAADLIEAAVVSPALVTV